MRPQRVSDRQIEQAAAAVFLQHGPSAPLGAIAASLGITQPGLLHRVGTKEALLVRALCPGVPEALMLLDAGPPAGCLIEDLETALAGLLGFLYEALPALAVLRFAGIDLTQVLPDGPPPPVAARQALAAWIRRCGDRMLHHLPGETVADLLVGSLEARSINRHLGGQPVSAADDHIYIRGLIAALLQEQTT